MLQEFGHQYFGVFVHLEVGQGVWAVVGRVRVQGLGFQVDVHLPALFLLLPGGYVSGFDSDPVCGNICWP